MFEQDLAQLSLFTDLDADQLGLIREMIETVTFPAGTLIFEQGDPAAFLYIVVSGEVQVRYKPYDGPAITVATVRPGGVFGWSAALGRTTYTSAAISTQPTEAYQVRGARLQKLCECSPETGTIILERLANVIAQRLSSTHNQILSILSQGLDSDGDCMQRINNHGHA